jgi:hypothetical protein
MRFYAMSRIIQDMPVIRYNSNSAHQRKRDLQLYLISMEIYDLK